MLDVAYCCDNGYIPYVSVSMISCIENNINDFDRIVFHIIVEGVSEESKSKIEWIVNSYDGCEVKFYPFSCDIDIPESHYPPIGYATLFLPDLVDVDKIVYVDGDTLILDSFKELYETDLGDNYGAAVLDITHPMVKHDLGFSDDDCYYNAGFFFMDLDRIRQANVQKVLLEEATKPYKFHDQDILNYVLKDKVLTLSPKYDFYGYFFELDYRYVLELFSVEGKTYSRNEVEEAMENIVCTHFLNLFSDVPWRDDTNPMYGEFRKYADKSSFSAEEIFTPTNFPLWKIIAHKVVRNIPKSIYIPFARRYMTKLFTDKYK